jgi:hypothetical protein
MSLCVSAAVDDVVDVNAREFEADDACAIDCNAIPAGPIKRKEKGNSRCRKTVGGQPSATGEFKKVTKIYLNSALMKSLVYCTDKRSYFGMVLDPLFNFDSTSYINTPRSNFLDPLSDIFRC